MNRRIGVPYLAVAASLAALPLAGAVQAAELPPIKISDNNKVAECATPGRLMSYLKSRNDKLDARYDGLATEYMRHGEALGIRWDYAFFQMLLETGYLKYTGDVKAEQNNFAGLGATGGGVRGESFKDISSGTRAHLEHVLMYSGATVENPVAQRTRDVQSWGVLNSWQKGIGSPVTFAHLASKWAPGTKAYASDIRTIADRFFAGPCKGEDPHPEMVAEARGQSPAAGSATIQATATTATPPQAPAQAAKADAGFSAATPSPGNPPPADMAASRAGLGASSLAAAGNTPSAPPAVTPAAAAASPTVTILNQTASPAPEDKAGSAEQAAATVTIETASVAGAAKGAAAVEKKANPKCRVWTASYGGAKAIIIKATSDQTTNYTVLDVNEGTEQREADAYINAYAKGGESVGEFASQSQALDKAFELCPEG